MRGFFFASRSARHRAAPFVCWKGRAKLYSAADIRLADRSPSAAFPCAVSASLLLAGRRLPPPRHCRLGDPASPSRSPCRRSVPNSLRERRYPGMQQYQDAGLETNLPADHQVNQGSACAGRPACRRGEKEHRRAPRGRPGTIAAASSSDDLAGRNDGAPQSAAPSSEARSRRGLGQIQRCGAAYWLAIMCLEQFESRSGRI